MTHALHGRQLKTVVVAISACLQLCLCAKSRINRLQVWKWSKASLAHSLIFVDLRQIGLIHRARAYALRLNAARASKLMLNF